MMLMLERLYIKLDFEILFTIILEILKVIYLIYFVKLIF